MDKEKWTDEEIESRLKELPKLTDERSKEEILQRLKRDERLRPTPPKTPKIPKWMPVAAVIAATFFVIMLGSSLMDKVSQQDSAENSTADEADIVTEEREMFSANDASTVENMHRVILEETVGYDDVYFSMALMSNRQAVPVTIILSAEQVEKDFPSEEVTPEMLYEKYAGEIDIASLGFDRFRELDKQSGAVSYFKYIGESGEVYLVPKATDQQTVEETLLEMKNRPDEHVETIIPESIYYDVTVQGEVAKVRFEEELDLSIIEEADATMLIEGFMLTAAQFNVAVEFENIRPDTWAGYDIRAPLPKPIGSNPLYDLYE